MNAPDTFLLVVELDGIGPLVWMVVPQVSPLSVAVVRTADARALADRRPAAGAKPAGAVVTAHAQFEQRVALRDVGDAVLVGDAAYLVS